MDSGSKRRGFNPRGGMGGMTPAPTLDGAWDARPWKPEFDEQGNPIFRKSAGAFLVEPAIDAAKDFYADPSIPTATNLGVQGSLLAMRPMGAIKALGGGLSAALAKDSGALDYISSSYAGSKKKKAQASTPEPAAIPDLPGLSGEQNARYKDVMGRIERGEYESGAARRALEAEANGYRDTSNEYSRATNKGQTDADAQRKLAEQEEYSRSVQRAEDARDTELGRKRRFSDTEFGKTFNKTGGAGAALAGLGAGAIHRAAAGPAKGFMDRYAMPAIEGAGAAFIMNNIPLLFDAFLTDPDNPEKAAYDAYARELPPSHPRKQEFSDYASKLPSENPVRAEASREFYDGFGHRLGASAIEGAPSAMIGRNLIDILGRGYARGGNGPTKPTDPTGPTPGPKTRRVTKPKSQKAPPPPTSPTSPTPTSPNGQGAGQGSGKGSGKATSQAPETPDNRDGFWDEVDTWLRQPGSDPSLLSPGDFPMIGRKAAQDRLDDIVSIAKSSGVTAEELANMIKTSRAAGRWKLGAAGSVPLAAGAFSQEDGGY